MDCAKPNPSLLVNANAGFASIQPIPASYPGSAQTMSAARRPSRASQIADDAARSVIVPAVAAGILLAREASARIAGIADGTRLPAVLRAIIEDVVAVFASRNRGDDGARLHGDRPAAAITPARHMQRLVGGKSRHIHRAHLRSPFGWLGFKGHRPRSGSS